MKKLILTAAFLSFAAAAHADGFICENADHSLNVKIYNNTTPVLGTRNAAVMIVSNPSAAAGQRTIATFNTDSALLTSSASNYTAKVDLRFKGSNDPAAPIMGTTLGNLQQIYLSVDFSYAQPVPAGAEVSGEVILTLRSASPDMSVPMTCTRYEKN